MNELREIKNFGPYMVEIMNKIGIYTKEELLAADYKKIRDDLQKNGIQPHLNIFYSIEMGLQGRSWNDISKQEKKEIQKLLSDQ